MRPRSLFLTCGCGSLHELMMWGSCVIDATSPVCIPGPDSEAVVGVLRALGAVGVLGNNDAAVLSYLDGIPSTNPALRLTASTL